MRCVNLQGTKSKAGTVDCSGFAYIRLMNYYFFTEEGV